MKLLKIILYLVLFGFLAVSCKHEPLITPIPIQELTEDPGCDDNVVYFEEQILPILQGCATTDCHDATTAEDGVILDSYDNIMNSDIIEPGDPLDSDLYEAITDDDIDDRMPPEPNDPLDSETIALIYNWIQEGAVENSCPDLICDTLEVTFAQDIQPMVNSFCAGCHSGILPYGGINIETYDQIYAVAGESLFLDMIDGNIDFVMPENTDGLTDCQVRMFEIWIEDGRPNN